MSYQLIEPVVDNDSQIKHYDRLALIEIIIDAFQYDIGMIIGLNLFD